MKLTKPTILFFICMAFAALIISSCLKNGVAAITQQATVINSGDPAADGCGWFIKINSTDSTYSPTNLPDAYKKDNLQVHITFDKLKSRYYCSQVANDPGPGITQIQINSIKTP